MPSASHLRSVALLVAASLTGPGAVRAQSCQPDWEAMPGSNMGIQALLTGHLGGSTALYASGTFTVIGGTPATYVGRWDGSQWSTLGSGISGQGPTGGPFVSALAEFDDGTGLKLYVAGDFGNAGGQPARCVARWDGVTWSALGMGINGPVYALAVYNSGSGPALYAGGLFTTAGTTSAVNIARWNGTTWSRLTNPGTNGVVNALQAFDDGSGPALYVGGQFTSVGNVSIANIARWNGTTWSQVGDGLNNTVDALGIFDDGGGAQLYAGGEFWRSGAAPVNDIGRWTGSQWVELATGISGPVRALAAFDDGNGPALYAGGGFGTAGVITSPNIIRWDGSTFAPLGQGPIGTTGQVNALAALPGSQPRLMIGGMFQQAGNLNSPNIAAWRGCSPCYPNCDESTAPPILNVNDFLCFINRLAAGDSYANCDGSTTPPVLNVNDFACFQNSFAAGCP